MSPASLHEAAIAGRFRDRREAGRLLARMLSAYSRSDNVVVLGIAKGGLPVAIEVAQGLSVPLDVLPVEKIFPPFHNDWEQRPAFGAIAATGDKILDDRVLALLRVSAAEIEEATAAARAELAHELTVYRNGCPSPDISGRTAILVDHGIESGTTARTAIAAARGLHPCRVVLAVPFSPAIVCEELNSLADEIVCPVRLPYSSPIRSHYDNYSGINDEEVRALVEAAALTPKSGA